MKLLKVVRKCHDGWYRRFEQKMASTVLDLADNKYLVDPEVAHEAPHWDYPVWVTTGVFKTRKEAFKRKGVHHEDRS